MNLAVKSSIGLALAALAWVSAAPGQASNDNRAASLALASSNGEVAVEGAESGAVFREIDDPHTGERWLLTRDPRHPGGPGRMVLASGPADYRQNAGAAASVAGALPVEMSPPWRLPVIHMGDRLIVEERTALAEARLEAVALGPAFPGSPLKVRLVAGGLVVRAVALAPGRAALAPEAGGRP